MGLSIRAKRWLAQEAARKRAERIAAAAAAADAAAAFHRDYLTRDAAAAALGISSHKFKREQLAGRGPVPTKTGDTPQSRVFWARAEIAAFLADPATYNARRAAKHCGNKRTNHPTAVAARPVVPNPCRLRSTNCEDS